MFNLFLSVVRRDLMLALRQKSDLVQTIFFFAVVVTLVPLGVGAEQNVLRTMAPGVVWVAALLAALLSLPRIFALDYADGTLEQMLISAEPLSVIVVGKVVAHWLVTGIPITVFAAVFGILFDLPVDQTAVLMFSLLLGTPVLSLVGAIGAALTLGLRAGSVLTSLLVLPLYIPVLIFGAGATVQVAISVSPAAYLMVTAGLSFFCACRSALCGGGRPSDFTAVKLHPIKEKHEERIFYPGRFLPYRGLFGEVALRPCGRLRRRRVLPRLFCLPH